MRRRFGRWRAPVALLTQVTFLLGSVPVRSAHAAAATQGEAPAVERPSAPAPEPTSQTAEPSPSPSSPGAAAPSVPEREARAPVGLTPLSLPTGGDKTGVSSQAI